ncbi:ABC transporter permease [Flagellimonas sp.]|uniref:ABC transporter permease n=1 Tax=Flagellimonas sp. TaxID=2058762 RepID=UPI003B5C3087
MIKKTFVKEIKQLTRDGRVATAFFIVLGLLAMAIWISSEKYSSINQEYRDAKSAERAIWDNQGEKNPHSAAHYGTYAFKPKYPLSLLDQGIDKYAGTSIFLEAHKRNEAQFSMAADQTGLARFGDLTPDFILLFIIPLLIVLLGYNSFTKEHEMGTLALLKSQGTSAQKLTLGKWLALMSPIFLITTVLFLIAGTILSNLDDFGAFSWGSLGMLYLVFLSYYAIFINLVLITSSIVKKSGISLVLSLSIWITASLLVPKISSNIAETQYPYPTRQEFAANVLKDKLEGLDGHDPWSKQSKQLEKQVLEEYEVDSLHQLPFNFDAYRMQKGEEHEAEVYFKHYKYLKNQFIEQSKVYRGLAAFSPFLPTRFLSMAIAKTDYTTHWNFADAAEDYRIKTQAFLNNNFAQNSSYGDWSYRADADTWKKIPQFEYEPSQLGEILSHNVSNLLIISVWLLASFSFLFITTKKI